jgi:hypothetical protein
MVVMDVVSDERDLLLNQAANRAPRIRDLNGTV